MNKKTLVLIWVALLSLLGVSFLLAAWGNVAAATTLIFSVALIKSALVVTYYMRLKWEPGYVALILLVGIVFMLILYLALIPDIVYRYGG